MAEISMPQLSDYQTGKDKPGALALMKLARAGGVTVDWILGLDQTPLVREAAADYKAIRLDRDLLKPFLPMPMFMWLLKELPRLDPKAKERVQKAALERCAFDDQMVWEVGE